MKSKPLGTLLARVASPGVEGQPEEDRLVRLVNLASFFTVLASGIFAAIEAPLMLGRDDPAGAKPGLFVLRVAAVLPFFAPIWLNALGYRRAARFALTGWSLLFVLFLVALYGNTAPGHLFFFPLLAAILAVFPARDRLGLALMIGLTAIAFTGSLLWRADGEPIVAVLLPEVRARIQLFVPLGCFFVVFMVAMAQRVTTLEAEARTREERARAEALLLNVLPESIADRLKTKPGSIADGFEDVTVMFADLVGFTPLSQRLRPDQLVDLMDRIFSEFDELCARYGLEKIKTIGDAYMVAGGLPEPGEGHTADMADMALAILERIGSFEVPGGGTLALRIGIARGAAVAGVIGRHKFIYDLWGDTVNTAARLESHGEPGRIQVDERVHEILSRDFVFESRGLVELKGKGPVKVWFLTGRR